MEFLLACNSFKNGFAAFSWSFSFIAKWSNFTFLREYCAKISQWLKVDTIHIITYGSQGALGIGNRSLDRTEIFKVTLLLCKVRDKVFVAKSIFSKDYF